MSVYTFETRSAQEGRNQTRFFTFEAPNHWEAGRMLCEQEGGDLEIIRIRKRRADSSSFLSWASLELVSTADPDGRLLGRYVQGVAWIVCVPIVLYLFAYLTAFLLNQQPPSQVPP